MNTNPISVQVGDDHAVETFLAERIYEFNATATGYHDGQSFNAVHRDTTGVIRAGIFGYTWGGCCYVSYLWVHESLRGLGIGSALLSAAEDHARSRECALMILSTHSFQAPNFYAARGYEPKGVIEDHPVGFASVVLVKKLIRPAGSVP